MTNSANRALSQWSLDREIVMSRVIDAPRDLVFEAWSDPKHLPQWFGPKGFKLETFEIDVRVGGVWRFNMIGPDGTVYPNRMRFRRIERPSLMEIEHGAARRHDQLRRRRIRLPDARQARGVCEWDEEVGRAATSSLMPRRPQR